MVSAKELQKLPAIGARQLTSQIEILHSEAFADAALHDPTGTVDLPHNGFEAEKVDQALANERERQRALSDMTDFAARQFDGTEEDVFLKAAFDNLKALVKARAMEETAAGQRDYYVQEAIDTYEGHLATLNEKIANGDLPEENRTSFTEAFQAATSPVLAVEWEKLAERRSKQEFRSL